MRKRIVLFSLLLIAACSRQLLATNEKEEEEEVETFSDIDVNKLDNGPIRFGVKFYDWGTLRYKKIFKALGPVFNTGSWPTLWEVSQSAPAPWEATDERMDMWVESVYRNLQNKKSTMVNATEVFNNASIEVIAGFLGLPEAYCLQWQQKEYRAKKKAEEEEVEADLSDFYFSYNGLDNARKDDAGKFMASSVDLVHGYGARFPYVQLFERVGEPDKNELHVLPEEINYLVKKTREEMDARDFKDDRIKIMVPGVIDPEQLVPYLKALGMDKKAYDALYALTTHVVDKGGSLLDIQESALKLRRNLKKYLPSDWDPKPVIVNGFMYKGPDELQYHGMRFYGDIEKCYDDKYQRTGHMVLKDSLPQSPWYAVRLLAGLMLQMSHGLPWVIYNQGADQWWQRHCDGLLDRDDRPKQIMAAFESVLPYMTNETYPIAKQWQNFDDCYIAAFKSVQKKMRVIVVVTNFSPKVCERSFNLKGIDLWDIQKARIVTYNNGTVAVNADKPYRALLTSKLLTYDVYDVDDGSSSGPDIEFDLTVGPYASATAIIDAKAPKGKRKRKPKTDKQEIDGASDGNSEKGGENEDEEEEIVMDEEKDESEIPPQKTEVDESDRGVNPNDDENGSDVNENKTESTGSNDGANLKEGNDDQKYSDTPALETPESVDEENPGEAPESEVADSESKNTAEHVEL